MSHLSFALSVAPLRSGMSIEIAVLILDSRLRVRSYIPCAGPLLSMTPADLGRSFRIAARLGLDGSMPCSGRCLGGLRD